MAPRAAVLLVSAWLVLLASSAARSQLVLVGKPGGCSPASVLQVCSLVCRSDWDCNGRDKCCPTACGGSACSRPVSAPRPVNIVKAGACPARPAGPWVCANRCSVDTDCRGNLKCCKNRCGALACQRPVPVPVPVLVPVL